MKLDDIGKELKRIRVENNIKAREVEEATLYSQAHIYIMENTGRKLSITSLCRILDFYGYELEFKRKEQIE